MARLAWRVRSQQLMDRSVLAFLERNGRQWRETEIRCALIGNPHLVAIRASLARLLESSQVKVQDGLYSAV